MLRPVKYLGQHFLSDKNIARKIAEAVNPQPDDVIVEIGAGEGFLTEQFVGRVKKVFAVEVDKRAVDFLKVRFGAEELVREDRIEIIHQDFLKLDLKMFEGFGKVRLIGNIPYSITSSIIFKAIENRNLIKDLTIMVQLEVAMRIVSNPGVKDYSILSVLCQAYSKPEILFRVSRNVFYPKPKVSSAVIRLDFEKGELSEKIIDDAFFKKIVKTAFNKRRKILKNTLAELFDEETLSRLNFDLSLRPEQLSVEEFIELSNMLYEILEEKNKEGGR
ncbi:16S rRNA (adenine1518-N6/adenine1519-N6)-dimethyltransferase [Candidatus Kryptonium thompsonii]|jgi:16S rRNA (adenine1518-N6/adenine1519-N6)-dimethyltransferase|uniref:Ribosomal RNA small subunit methyltransferase A n=1 Tax=Candidatus Kryptonium thompsonii TaxID=1633631 RepID=A0A0P1LP63_9BACT|nr:16S rRNA (adenine(1518)-N(6)/adenine(1519)-N(6))-dimethyltransferase RsmA [Candidatus Kryptonium thompsoni]CUS83416.1 16S rRNA (adenine1518-N6/adenine1519-N6)-dimethyltransferase [Candidatus Kryptonium thompsoni]CUS86096.1 16S rRNA (adenine1518-N6/adenine1519-N6)-dimethyltransferase [Candidatus Kryptonium thompsoni]CUS86373.1 16S rRNA (adenine1518-N6/adenine1519-N6)-dimethyltransferase [Candidatus Kryptonium thompsoni]CUS91823.1 16S rRNA (adenine1518-N6/adenine1519-N6)-dimethyltransferase [C